MDFEVGEGVVGWCGWGVGSRLVWVGWGGEDWWGGGVWWVLLCCHTLQCVRLSCVRFVVVFGGRVFCRLPVPDFFFVFDFAGVLLYGSVWGVWTVLCCWFGILGRCLLGGGSMSLVCGGWVLLGVGLFKGRLPDVAGGGAWVAVVSCLSSNRRDLRVGLSLSGF